MCTYRNVAVLLSADQYFHFGGVSLIPTNLLQERMRFARAFDDAGTLLTLLGLLAVVPVLTLMTRAIGNPEFDVLGTFELVVYAIVDALMPAFLLTSILAIGILVIAKANW